jgi:hypothetical protein
MNRDFAEMLGALSARQAEFLVVGAYAMAAHGVPRATGDIDIWVRPTSENARKVWAALQDFGAPLMDLTLEDLQTQGMVFQIGIAPSRIDILTRISGVEFEAAWTHRVEIQVDNHSIPVLGKLDLIANKKAAGRPKDQLDVSLLEQP